MENRLAEVVDKAVIMDLDAEINLCSCENDVVDETYSLGGNDKCGDGMFIIQTECQASYLRWM